MNSIITALAGRVTARRLHGYGVVLTLSLWAVALFVLATPGRIDRMGNLKGTDFATSWVSGRLVATGQSDNLYDWATWEDSFAALFADVPGGLLYLPNYPPQAGLLFAPFGALPFSIGLLLWTVVSVALYAGSCWLICRTCLQLRPYFPIALLLAIGWPAFYLLVLNGQNTTLILACYAAAWVCFRAGRDFWMGVAFGAAAIKPHFIFVPALVLLFSRRWRAVAGLASSGLVQIAAIVAVLGVDVLLAYVSATLKMMRHLELFKPKVWQAHGLYNALDLLLGDGPMAAALYAALGSAILVLAARAWNSGAAPALRFALLILVAAILNPHLYGYDLVAIAPALLLIADWAAAAPDSANKSRAIVLLGALYLVPLAAPLAAFTRVQISTLLMLALAWLNFRLVSQTAGQRVPAAA